MLAILRGEKIVYTRSECARIPNSSHLSTISSNSTGYVSDRPLIGILTQPGNPAPGNQSYIAASYIKFVESAGARAVPIPYDAPRAEVQRLFRAVNGALIPGGGQNLSPHHPFFDTSALLLNLSIAANDAGDFFPLHGTCLGFEALAVIVSGDGRALTKFDSYDNASPLVLTEDGKNDSTFFGAFPPEVLRGLQEQPLAMENHGKGLAMSTYEGSERLKDFFVVTSLSSDRRHAVYISTMEARKYPITATQWHPEKNSFEWARKLQIPHSSSAVEVTHAAAKYLVDQARKNTHSPASQQEEEDILIYNYPTTYTGKGDPGHPGKESDFDECYFFEPYNASSLPAAS
ncbi:class I glutamine amidotransferase-like protein [Coccomyxa subellipsoidea C-169]|uniref:folate gamma-glutamyl hydrolase n=1 Tax=Coccomyxa subellipsoidea (strain C-169) TaxID=574566 RepID=I0YRJ2_COCSC|nr:class I glutamine amidotransferase-like protein [Coccomyxa subellipsoidea C-169]EIE21011.1 class I glutamine amidotransferase-like protein [Coccomyxa subellipsoidea C-169]|eukprot:XP_005645555.1 class I glutamine amidotransferase-like protein [Coccomyxa subellipsoidea C-169]